MPYYEFEAATQDYTLRRGDTFYNRVEWTWTAEAEAAQGAFEAFDPDTGDCYWTARLQVRDDTEDTTALATLTSDPAAGITIIQPGEDDEFTMAFDIVIPAATTAGFPVSEGADKLFYDLEITEVSGRLGQVKTPLAGKIKVLADSTRSA